MGRPQTRFVIDGKIVCVSCPPFLKANNWRNLRPMWAKDNIRKGGYRAS